MSLIWLLLIGFIIISVQISAISYRIQFLQGEVYDIKKNLKIPTAAPTKDKLHEEVLSQINEYVKLGMNKDKIMQVIRQAYPHIGNSKKLKKHYKKIVEYKIETHAE